MTEFLLFVCLHSFFTLIVDRFSFLGGYTYCWWTDKKEHVNASSSYYYYYNRRIYLNLSKPTQSAAGLKSLKPAAHGRYLMCKSLPYYFHLLYRSTFILLLAKCMLGLFVFP